MIGSWRRRVAAIGAITCDAVALMIVAFLVLSRPVVMATAGAVAMAFLVSSFLTLGAKGVVRWMAGFTAAVLAAGLVALLVIVGIEADHHPGTAPLAILALALGAYLGRVALRTAPPTRAEVMVTVGSSRTTKRPVLLMNPRSGGGKVAQFDLVTEARDLGIEAIVLEPGDDLSRLARRALDGGAGAIGMAGGDGSQAGVLALAVEYDVPFVCVPAGTRNHFALDLGLERTDPRQALTAFINGEERQIDYATVNDRPFVNNVALGIYAALVEQATYRDAKLQTALDLLPTLAAAGGPWFDLCFDVPEHGRVEQSALLMVSNNPYDIGTEIRQRPRLDSGELGILTLNPENLGDLLEVTLLAVARQPRAAKALWSWTAPTFAVESAHKRVSAGIDGESVELQTPMIFRAVPRGARVLVPAGSRLGLDEQRAKAGARYSGLLEVAFNLPAGNIDGGDQQ